jgi:hypothetical protein
MGGSPKDCNQRSIPAVQRVNTVKNLGDNVSFKFTLNRLLIPHDQHTGSHGTIAICPPGQTTVNPLIPTCLAMDATAP